MNFSRDFYSHPVSRRDARRHSGIVCGCLGALLFCVGSAHATTTSSVVVHYGDLNLSAPADVRTLSSRIRQAAQEVCGRAYEARDLQFARAYRQCISTAVDGAVKQIHPSAALTSLEGK